VFVDNYYISLSSLAQVNRTPFFSSTVFVIPLVLHFHPYALQKHFLGAEKSLFRTVEGQKAFSEFSPPPQEFDMAGFYSISGRPLPLTSA